MRSAGAAGAQSETAGHLLQDCEALAPIRQEYCRRLRGLGCSVASVSGHGALRKLVLGGAPCSTTAKECVGFVNDLSRRLRHAARRRRRAHIDPGDPGSSTSSDAF
ncbi:unnamed protein product [Polarella glacialis]|uniref:Uncharacterized protein n=1 Tax=Polarella glacialis TaxID=89957 RepID=A0A813GU15_POLGL|nr:unnamed protein product [Polarella glacialis]CAE8733176.1 unnamed protein product [Polarella glacialis]